MNSFSDRKLEKFLDGLQAAIEDDRAAINGLARDVHQLRSQQTTLNKKLDALIADANEKKNLQRIEAINDVVKNDRSFKTIAIVTTGLTFVAIVFAVLLAVFWRK
jgi:phage shock protein A